MSQAAFDVIVIGEGVSGLAAAGMLASSKLNVATMEAQLFGGLVINVNELEPGVQDKPASGAELAAEMMQANAEAGVASIQEPVTSLRIADTPGNQAQLGSRPGAIGGNLSGDMVFEVPVQTLH